MDNGWVKFAGSETTGRVEDMELMPKLGEESGDCRGRMRSSHQKGPSCMNGSSRDGVSRSRVDE
jgi:hypothetical protein